MSSPKPSPPASLRTTSSPLASCGSIPYFAIGAILFIYLFFSLCAIDSLPFPDAHTYPIFLKACLDIRYIFLGAGIHSYVYKLGLSCEVTILNFLVEMYVFCDLVEYAKHVFDRMPQYDEASRKIMVGGYLKCEDFGSARNLFNDMPERNVVSWSVMINGYVQDIHFKKGLELFWDMLEQKTELNLCWSMFLSACAHLGAMKQGKWIEEYMKRKNVTLTIRLGTTFIDMYSKCGYVEKAPTFFLEMKEKNVQAWSAMINGLGKEALHLFSQMEMEGVKPNDVTFIGLLNACSYSRMIDEVCSFFDTMAQVYGIKPNAHHYCCMVDLYGRAGVLNQAESIIRSMPFEPNSGIWGALLNTCRIHGDIELGEQVGQRLLELEPNHIGRWNHVAELRKVMRERGINKLPGCSPIGLGGRIHEFSAGDNAHPESEMIYAKLYEPSI